MKILAMAVVLNFLLVANSAVALTWGEFETETATQQGASESFKTRFIEMMDTIVSYTKMLKANNKPGLFCVQQGVSMTFEHALAMIKAQGVSEGIGSDEPLVNIVLRAFENKYPCS